MQIKQISLKYLKFLEICYKKEVLKGINFDVSNIESGIYIIKVWGYL